MIENAANPKDIELIVIDNHSKEPFNITPTEDPELYKLIQTLYSPTCKRLEKNTGIYPDVFQIALEMATSPVVAFFHSDLFVYQHGWDTSVIDHFDANANLGLLGFIGSTQMDGNGGRGLGTHSNMQGRTTEAVVKLNFAEDSATSQPAMPVRWTGSKATIHGKQDAGFIIDGAVVDGCVMIFRKEVLETMPWNTEYPPHHFYDRMMSLQVLEKGFKVGILGIEFDHISGQTANQEGDYHTTAKDWAFKRFGITSPEAWAVLEENKAWVARGDNPSRGQIPHGWDHVVYLSAEKLFLEEYRDIKRIIPVNC